MGQATWTFLGVILGAAIAGAISLAQVRFMTARERKAQEMRREQEHMDRRESLERETLLALQDTIAKMRRIILRDYERRTALMAEGGAWPEPSVSVLLTGDWLETDDRLISLRTRVLDQKLQWLVDVFGEASTGAMTAKSQAEANDSITQAGVRLAEINARIGALLPRLL
jgi:hypothetical protein